MSTDKNFFAYVGNGRIFENLINLLGRLNWRRSELKEVCVDKEVCVER